MKENTKFTRGFTIFSATIMGLSLIVYLFVPKIAISPNFPFIVLFLYLVTVLMLHYLRRALQDKMSKFVNIFMLLNFGKLVVYSSFILIYAFLYREDAVSFILTFFVYYFLFTAYEVIALLKFQKSI